MASKVAVLIESICWDFLKRPEAYSVGVAVGLGRIPPESTAAMGQENWGMVGFRSFFAGLGNGNPGGWRPSHACLAGVGGSAEVVQSAVERCEVLLVVDKRCKR